MIDFTSMVDIDKPLPHNQARRHLTWVLNNGTVIWSNHVQEEMRNDNMLPTDVTDTLRLGRIYEPAEFENDSWRYRVHTERFCVVVTFVEPGVVLVTTWRKKR